MAVSDLTNTTWIINSTTCNAGYGNYQNLNYRVSSNSEFVDYTWLLIGYRFSFDNGAIATANRVTYMTINRPAAVNDIITITGGTDVTNASLIAWLEANAVQQVSPTDNKIFIGSNSIDKAYFGSTEIQSMYLGNTKIY